MSRAAMTDREKMAVAVAAEAERLDCDVRDVEVALTTDGRAVARRIGDVETGRDLPGPWCYFDQPWTAHGGGR